MALKRKVTKTEFAALNPLIQAEYTLTGDEYVLNAEGFEDPAELKRAKDREVEARKAAEEKATKATEELRLLKEGTARSSGDIVTLEKSYKDKEALREKEHKAELAKRDTHLKQTLIDAVALKLAAELGGENAALLLPHITPRLTADVSGDVPLTRVLDKDGKPSAFSVEDLKKEISTDARFKSVIVVSNATGGGAAGGGTGGGSGAPTDKTKKFNDLTPAERAAWYKEAPAEFEAASKANQTAIFSKRVEVQQASIPRSL